jgi:hypothetical protein
MMKIYKVYCGERYYTGDTYAWWVIAESEDKAIEEIKEEWGVEDSLEIDEVHDIYPGVYYTESQ